MSNYEDYLYEAFRLNFPRVADHAVDWHESNLSGELVVKLDSGETVIFDNMDRSIRVRRKDRELDDAGRPIFSENDWRREFGAILEKQMRLKGMTQSDLSQATGISRLSINNYINGKASPSLYNVTKITRALGCSADIFIHIE